MSAMAVEAPVERTGGAELKPLYLESLTLVERLHRRMLDLIKDEFDRAAVHDLNSAQALILFNLGDSELPAGELRKRGYYLGSNVSYNLKKLIALGYLRHQPSLVDRRSISISLTEKGRGVAQLVDRIYERHVGWIDQVSGGLATTDIEKISDALRRLDRFLTDQILYRL
jgi:DNA-binding MarR family transcriptional regulator